MNLATLKTTCAAYLRVSESTFTSGSTDLFLVAANNARMQAEMFHNFEYSRVTASLVFATATSVVDLSVATLVPYDPDSTFIRLKQIEAVLGTSRNGSLIPLPFMGRINSLTQLRDEQTLDNSFSRYPADWELDQQWGRGGFVQIGNQLRIMNFNVNTVSSGPITVSIEGYAFLVNYQDVGAIDDADQDYMLVWGGSYMQWATICELNYLSKAFVPRQEGNLEPPEKKRDEALRQLILWDSFLMAEGTTFVK